jgi:hypothetical protein
MRNLAAGVNAGIGAASAADDYPLTAKGGEGGLDRLLNGRPIRLPLPADEQPAIIFDREFLARHRALWSCLRKQAAKTAAQ